MTTETIIDFGKRAETAHPIHDLIAERWSPRAFADRPVDQATLHSLFEAARWAPSAANFQPWSFIVATAEQPEAHARIVSTLMDGNVLWAQHAPVLIVAIAKISDRAGYEYVPFYDLGLATSNLVFEAGSRGLVLHQMGGFFIDKVRSELGVPEGYQPLAVIALGYPGEAETLPDALRERERAPRSRKATSEFVFEGHWPAETAQV